MFFHLVRPDDGLIVKGRNMSSTRWHLHRNKVLCLDSPTWYLLIFDIITGCVQLYFNIGQQLGVITNNKWKLSSGNNIVKDNYILQQVWYHYLKHKGEMSAQRWRWSIPQKRNLANKPRRLKYKDNSTELHS